MITLSELSHRLTEDRTWRIRELSELVRSCDEAKSVRRDALTRAIVPVFYAHWEGYFVLAANNYLSFLSTQRLPLSSLRDEFWVLAMRKKYKSNQISGDKNFFRFLHSLRQEKDTLFKQGNYEKINGKSNLNSEVMESCCAAIGICSSSFKPYYEFIDKKLIDKRNFIAHGESLRFKYEDVPDYRDRVIDLMRVVHNQFENAATSSSFLK